MLLEPAEVKNRFEVVDFGKTRTNKKYADAAAQYPGKEIVNQDEMDQAEKMIYEIGQHPLASRIIAGATAEMPYTWTDKETGLPCKCKIDAIKRTKNGIVVIDYKTSSDIQSVLNWPQKLQYPLQAEFYSQAVKEKYGEDPCEFIFIIQSNKEGEEDVIAVANVEYDTGLVAKDIVKSHMKSIATRLKSWDESHDKSIWAAYPNRVEMRYSNWYMDRGE
jgi:2-succinyl-5-enolpyruvyl-6-hydroxy-3-cyclohexene-1-carboxylate synthase